MWTSHTSKNTLTDRKIKSNQFKNYFNKRKIYDIHEIINFHLLYIF